METFVEALIPVGMLGGVFVYPILQFFAVRRMRGFWRFLALVPLVPMGYVLTVTFYAFYKESNVWPILLIFVGPIALLYLALLLLIHGLVYRSTVPGNG
ncbi:MAG: hypothetical protein HYY46_04210 [Deltaproteobacteria bacterium]|nr:hypothetical protein [Deltaproteobacteria bacterium]